MWALRGPDGFPLTPRPGGATAVPFWSTDARLDEVRTVVPALAGYQPVRLDLGHWRTRWLTILERDGVLVGLNWSGPAAAGYAVRPRDVEANLQARRRQDR